MNQNQESKYSFMTLKNLDKDWCLAEAEKMIQHHPHSELGNASGKFYKNYRCWHFHKSSAWPLIVEFQKQVEKHRELFESKMGKPLHYEFVVLTEVREVEQPISEWHKDGYFFDGQLHLTIQGQGGLSIRVEDKEVDLTMPDGQLWYLNGSHYYHTVKPAPIRRIELCAPVNPLKEDVTEKLKAVSQDPYKWLDGNNEDWIELRKRQVNYVKNAIKRGTASNFKIASFSIEE